MDDPGCAGASVEVPTPGIASPSNLPPLTGLRILDLTRVLSGPYATMILGDLGAEVIKVERPIVGDDVRTIPPIRDGESHYFLSANRNKRSIVVDLKCAGGPAVVIDLARQCDVVVENFRPGIADKLGVGYNAIKEVNPGIIYCSVSGFGQTGSSAGRSAFDIVIQALSGAMSVTGEPGRSPVRLGLPVADLSGGLFAAIGILAALVKRDATGKGEYIDVAMLDSTISLLGYLASSYFMTGESPQAVGGGHHSLVPYGVFEAKDGYMVIAVLTESIWPRLCLAAGLEDLAADDRYADNARRLERRTEVERLVGAAIRRRAIAEWCEILTEADVPHAPILSVAAALEQPQVQERGLIREVMHPAIGPTRTLGPVISFSSSGTGAVAPAPLLGADTEMVLRQIAKYSEEVVAKLEKDGVIHRAPPC